MEFIYSSLYGDGRSEGGSKLGTILQCIGKRATECVSMYWASRRPSHSLPPEVQAEAKGKGGGRKRENNFN